MDLSKMTRKEVIPLYVELIKEGLGFSQKIIDFNLTIINRWSNSALIYIKEEAWKVIKAEQENLTDYKTLGNDKES